MLHFPLYPLQSHPISLSTPEVPQWEWERNPFSMHKNERTGSEKMNNFVPDERERRERMREKVKHLQEHESCAAAASFAFDPWWDPETGDRNYESCCCSSAWGTRDREIESQSCWSCWWCIRRRRVRKEEESGEDQRLEPDSWGEREGSPNLWVQSM